MRQKMAIFKEEKAFAGYNFFRNGEIIGGDASENGDFQKGKQRLQGTKFVFFAFVSSVEIGGGDLEANGHFL